MSKPYRWSVVFEHPVTRQVLSRAEWHHPDFPRENQVRAEDAFEKCKRADRGSLEGGAARLVCDGKTIEGYVFLPRGQPS